jgi:hypothetical protein
LLFYGHHEFFKNGIDAFDQMANKVNAIQPQTKWVSLGEIARHLYQIRRRQDGAFDVKMFSNEMDLDNPTDQEAVLYIRYQDEPTPAIASIAIDGYPGAFERTASGMPLRLVIPPHLTRKVRLIYASNIDPLNENTRKTNLYAYVLRTVSDVRDLYLPRHAWGRAVVTAYYSHNIPLMESYLEHKLLLIVAAAFLIFVLCYLRQKSKKQVANRVSAS